MTASIGEVDDQSTLVPVTVIVTPSCVPLAGGSNFVTSVSPRSAHVGLPETSCGVTLAACDGAWMSATISKLATPATGSARPANVKMRRRFERSVVLRAMCASLSDGVSSGSMHLTPNVRTWCGKEKAVSIDIRH